MSQSRKVLTGLGLAAGVACLTGALPRGELGAVVQVTGFEIIWPFDGAKMRYKVTLRNSSTVDTNLSLQFQRSEGPPRPAQSVAIPAQGTATVEEDDGVDGINCGHAYAMWLEGNGADTRHRLGSTVTSCSFMTSIQDSLSQMTPDRRLGMENGHVFFAGTTASHYTCQGVHVETDVWNKNGVGAEPRRERPFLQASLNDVNGVSLWAGSFPPPENGKSRHLVIDTSVASGSPGAMTLTLSGNVSIADQAVRIDVTPSCIAPTTTLFP
jgi:hypothetical protein